jgi:hypothetical protein
MWGKVAGPDDLKAGTRYDGAVAFRGDSVDADQISAMERIRMSRRDIDGAARVCHEQRTLGGLIVGNGGDEVNGDALGGELRRQIVYLAGFRERKLLGRGEAQRTQEK